MSAKVGKVTCKQCGMVFAGPIEYLQFEGCDKGNCAMGKNKRARQAANEAIAKARRFGDDNKMEQVETKAVYQAFSNENEVIIDKVPKGVEAREKFTSNVVTFHVMKR